MEPNPYEPPKTGSNVLPTNDGPLATIGRLPLGIRGACIGIAVWAIAFIGSCLPFHWVRLVTSFILFPVAQLWPYITGDYIKPQWAANPENNLAVSFVTLVVVFSVVGWLLDLLGVLYPHSTDPKAGASVANADTHLAQ